jgi:hypothetical protein
MICYPYNSGVPGPFFIVDYVPVKSSSILPLRIITLTGIIHKQRSSGILPHNREKRQDAAATNSVYG